MIGKGFVLFKINSSPSAFYIIKPTCIVIGFYRAMHFSLKRGIAIACRLSVTLVDCDHIGWNSSKIISPFTWDVRSLQPQHYGSAARGTPLNLGPK